MRDADENAGPQCHKPCDGKSKRGLHRHGKIGDWISTESEIVKLGGSLGFVRCQLKTGDAIVARANATFKIA